MSKESESFYRPERFIFNGLTCMVFLIAAATICYRLIQKEEFDTCVKAGFQIKTDHNGVSCYK